SVVLYYVVYLVLFLLLGLCAELSCFSFFFFYCSADHCDLHSFPTRRSSDLRRVAGRRKQGAFSRSQPPARPGEQEVGIERKRLRSEEHTSELQSHLNLVCRLLLEKKKTTTNNTKQKYRQEAQI